jgi:hypothetical protein
MPKLLPPLLLPLPTAVSLQQWAPVLQAEVSMLLIIGVRRRVHASEHDTAT